MTYDDTIKSFIADWFGKFDRLEPIEAFLPDLHQEVVWEMDDVDDTLHGHARVKAWYASLRPLLIAPTEHHVSDIQISEGHVQFDVLFRAKTVAGDTIGGRVTENWRFEMRANGRPLITHYKATPLTDTTNTEVPA